METIKIFARVLSVALVLLSMFFVACLPLEIRKYAEINEKFKEKQKQKIKSETTAILLSVILAALVFLTTELL